MSSEWWTCLFHARSLYKLIDENQTYDDERKCASPDTCLVPPVPDIIQLENSYPNMGLCGVELNVSSSTDESIQYEWTIPENISYNSTSGFPIYMGFNSEFTYGQVCVTAANSCGTSPSRCLMMYGRPGPVNPSSIIGDARACENSYVNYNWDEVPGATSYTILTSSGNVRTTMPTSGTESLIEWGSNPEGFSIFASNSCGNSDTIFFADSCTTQPRLSRPVNLNESNKIKVFPNPTSGKVTMIYKLNSEKGKLILLSMLGEIKAIHTIIKSENGFEFQTSDLPNGLIEWRVYDGDTFAGRGSLIIMK